MCDVPCERLVAGRSGRISLGCDLRHVRHDDIRLALTERLFQCDNESSSPRACTAATRFAIGLKIAEFTSLAYERRFNVLGGPCRATSIARTAVPYDRSMGA